MMILLFRRRLVALAALLSLTAAGCGRSPPPYQLAEVTGVVNLDGKPAADLVVTFLPDSVAGTNGPRSSGKTDAQGQYRLVCDDRKPGAVVGLHHVLITDARASLLMREARKDDAVFPPSRIPKRYSTVANSPLRQEVKAEPQTIDLDVTSK
jgi:hypothetical protein